LYRLLEEEIGPSFYDDDGAAWLERQRASLRTLAPAFSATRMLQDYETKFYDLARAAR
jgi:starch phosphorylase